MGKDLKKVNKTYQLERWQEMSILAYIKLLEMMMKRAKDVGALDGVTPPTPPSTETDYTGSMFG